MSVSPLSGCVRHDGGRAGKSLSFSVRKPLIGDAEQPGDLAPVDGTAQRPGHGAPLHDGGRASRVEVAAAAGHHLGPVDDHRARARVPHQPHQFGLARGAAAPDARANSDHNVAV